MFFSLGLDAMAIFSIPKDFSRTLAWARVAMYRSTERGLIGLAMLFSWVLVLRYTSIHPKFALIISTLRHSSDDLGAFVSMLAVVFFGFVFSFYLTFGGELEDFSSFQNSAVSIIAGMSGNIDAQTLMDIAGWPGMISYVVFLLFFVFVLLTLFLAIINEGANPPCSAYSTHPAHSTHSAHYVTLRKHTHTYAHKHKHALTHTHTHTHTYKYTRTCTRRLPQGGRGAEGVAKAYA
jgi:preprotein translocase subunit SecG